MSSSDLGAYIGLGVDIFFYLIFYKWYKSINRNADEIKAAPYRKLDDKLIRQLSRKKSHYLPYACVEGEVLPVNQTLTSHHVAGKTGVVQHISVTEHRSKRDSGLWSDVKSTIQDKVQTVPFKLKRWLGKESTTEITVNDPTSASYLMDSLTVTHDHFEPSDRGDVFSRTVDHIFGEVPKGVHHTEKMLLTNTLLLGIGEVALKDGKLHLLPPRDGRMYVLTTMSKAELINRLSKKSFWVKVMVIITGVIGTSILSYILYKHYKRWQQDRTHERMLREMRELRETRDVSEGDADNLCIICMSRPREIVLLDCGHICLCANCVLQLPEPLSCPVCRRPVDRYITTYNP